MARNIPSSAIAQAATTNGVPVADITVIPDRMRRLRPDVVDELAESIAAQGLLHPITLRKRASDGAHVLVAGRHRGPDNPSTLHAHIWHLNQRLKSRGLRVRASRWSGYRVIEIGDVR